METYIYNKEAKTVKVKMNCQKCMHIKVCRFHSKMKEFANQNVMYQMTEYLEWNNLLHILEYHRSCQYFSPKYKMPEKGEPVNMDCDHEIIQRILYHYCNEIKDDLMKTKFKEYNGLHFFFQPNGNTDIENNTYSLILKTTNNEIGHGTIVYDKTVAITGIIKHWTFEN